ncbi:hypothetical protein FAZ15_13365 [Sphingobacterium olei]|uniref:Lipopolysaccharide biosynthesis protein n=1 Tax=Sphingobacterium olei TaxID=2571155 RepID=A0A4U0NYJ9_9SPHI|nr:oligosaccharide flippase family protein [Sphingobacterium olei]TJZ59879.1 hypothetical protein FAZ15_13365 [Sphingobacterium olei]
MSTSNNKRIAKNTLFLFLRMLVTVMVSLYTSRVVLDVLGVRDYGLYSVVGGVVLLFSFISTTMASSTQRFLNFEKGRGDTNRVERLFGTSLFVHIVLGLCLFIIVESAGLWMLNKKLNIDSERLTAANWIFHLSTISFVFTILNVPFRAAIIANEKMNVFALINVVEVLLKLIIAISIPFFRGDKLIWYGVLVLLSTLIVNAMYSIYSKRKFLECKGKICRDNEFLKSIFGFSSWTLLSGFSIVLRNQGLSILLNIFFGTTVNAAQGIANQVNTVITGFAANFTQAVNPQIVKDYAAGRMKEMRNMVMFSSRVSFILIFLIAFPIFVEADVILKIWLTTVPEYTVFFTRLVLAQALVESFASVHSTAQGATGKVKLYHFTLSLLGILNLPLSYFVLKAGAVPYSVLIISIIISGMISISRLIFLRKSIGLSLVKYFYDVVLRCLGIFLVSIPIPLLLKIRLNDSLLNTFLISLLSALIIGVSSFWIGISSIERDRLTGSIKAKFKLNRF